MKDKFVGISLVCLFAALAAVGLNSIHPEHAEAGTADRAVVKQSSHVYKSETASLCTRKGVLYYLNVTSAVPESGFTLYDASTTESGYNAEANRLAKGSGVDEGMYLYEVGFDSGLTYVMTTAPVVDIVYTCGR